MSGSASRSMVDGFAVGPVVPLPASAWSFWWVVVLVVRLCVAPGGAIGGWLCGGRPGVVVPVEGPATSQPVVAHAAALAGLGGPQRSKEVTKVPLAVVGPAKGVCSSLEAVPRTYGPWPRGL